MNIADADTKDYEPDEIPQWIADHPKQAARTMAAGIARGFVSVLLPLLLAGVLVWAVRVSAETGLEEGAGAAVISPEQLASILRIGGYLLLGGGGLAVAASVLLLVVASYRQSMPLTTRALGMLTVCAIACATGYGLLAATS